MLQPIKDVPFNLVIESICNHRVLPFNKNNKEDITLLETLKKVAKIAGKKINENGIIRKRANEVGNDIERYVKDALNKLHYKAEIPFAKSGKKKSTGYPDLLFIDEFSRISYLECKTYNVENISTTQRSFYLSPSKDFKVNNDAHHFVISFEMFVDGTLDEKYIYKSKGWKIISLENLTVDVKYEFQSDNKRLYAREFILAEGSL